MARVQVASMPWGVVQDRTGTALEGVTATITRLSGSAATVYQAATGLTTTPAVTDSFGGIAGWVEEGTYTLAVTVDGVARSEQVEAVSGRPLGWVNVKTYGATGDGTTDDTAAIQAAIDSLTSRGVVYVPSGSYRTTSVLTVQPNRAIKIRGDGMHRHWAGQYASKIVRDHTGSLISCAGTDDNTHGLLEMEDIELDGNSKDGSPVVNLYRVSEVCWRRVNVSNGSPSIGWSLSVIWNSVFEACNTRQCGSSYSKPAMKITSDASSAVSNTDTVDFVACEWEANNGPDILIDAGSTGVPVQQVHFIGGKVETSSVRSGGTFEQVYIDYANHISFTGMLFSVAVNYAAAVVKHDSSPASRAGIMYTGCSFQTSGTWAGVYHVQHLKGELMLTGCEFQGNPAPSSAFVTLAAAVGFNDVRTVGNRFTENTVVPVSDNRTGVRVTQSGHQKEGIASSVPAAGTWAVGDRVWSSAPAAAGTMGWVCTTAGTPGTWKTFGAIAA